MVLSMDVDFDFTVTRLAKIANTNNLSRMVEKLEWIEMAQLAVSSIVSKSLSLKLPYHLQSSFHDSVNAIRKGSK